MGFLTPVTESGAQDLPIPKQPHDKLLLKNAEMWGTVRASDIHFDRFLTSTVTEPSSCTAKQYVFGRPSDGMNGGPPIYMDRVTFNNVHDDAVAYIPDWPNSESCSGIPCTGPINILIDIRSATLSGTITPSSLSAMTSSLQIIGNNPGVAPAIDGSCNKKTAWNTYLCNGNEKLGTLYFESLDIDRNDRVFSPVNITGNVTSYASFDNEVDSMRETSWGLFL